MTDPIIENSKQTSREERWKRLRQELDAKDILRSEKSLDRHFTPEHARQHCTCTRPKDWLFTVIEIK